jgi:hypothetical protein
MRIKIGVLAILAGLFFFPATSASAQFCNPAAVRYIVRDEQGSVISGEELTTLHQQLPKKIGNADTSVDEVSFKGDGVSFYWRESVDWDKGKKVPALEFVNAGTCTLDFPGVELTYHGKKMRLIFNISIDRHQNDRRLVVDSLPFGEGTFELDLSSWPRSEDTMIPATFWKKVTNRKPGDILDRKSGN